MLSGGLTRTTGETVDGGPYTIAQGTLTANDNYTIAFTGNTLTITPATLTVTASPESKVYGQADPTLAYAASGYQFSDDGATVLTGGLTRAAGETVDGGPYTIAQGTLTANDNYTIVFTGNTLTITPATLTVTANPESKVYGQSDPTLAYAASGYQFSDDATVLSGGLTRAAGETVDGGPYAIAQGTLTANDNYTIAFTGNTLTITPATLAVTASPESKIYGQSDPTLAYAASGYQFSDDGATVLTGGLTRAAGETVDGGPYAIAQGTLTANDNYTIAFTGNTLTITPATLTVTASPESKIYGQSDPTLAYAASGYQFSDDGATVLTGGLTRAAGETVDGGPYAIAQGTLSANDNYMIVFTGNTLTITPATLAVTASPESKVYGQSDPTLAYAASGYQFSDDGATVLTGGLARAAGETVDGGPYTIAQGTLAANDNYKIAFTGNTLTITPATLAVTASPETKVYGQSDPTLAYAASGYQFSDDGATVLTGGLTRAAGETVDGGPYTIAQGTLAANDNYTIAFTGNTLTITPATLAVTASPESKVYGHSDPTLVYAASGYQFSDDGATVLTGGLTRAAGETVDGGPYAIAQGTLTANDNYKIAFTGNTLTITPATLAVTASPESKIYGQSDPTLAYAASGYQFSDDGATVLTGGLTRAAGETVDGGPYTIAQGTLTANDNYTIVFTGNTLTITPATLTVTASPETKVYGQSDPTLAYVVSGLQFNDTVQSSQVSGLPSSATPAGVLTGSLARAAGETVDGGPYAIAQGTLTANDNYTIAFTGNTLTITPATLTVTANPETKVYGQSDPTLAYVVSGYQFSDDGATVLSGGLTRAAGQTVDGGPYAISQGTLTANDNYTIVFTGNTLTITPATLTVTANPETKVYGQSDPTLAYAASGYQFSDDGATVLSGGLSRARGRDGGRRTVRHRAGHANG